MYQHGIISFFISISYYLVTKSLLQSAVVFITGVFLDLDHILDFLVKIKFNVKKFNVKELFRTYKNEIQPYYFLLLHGYEFAFIIPLIFYISGLKEIAVAVFIGYFTHLLLDNVFNKGKNFLRYFFVYRMFKKFKEF